MPKKVEMVGEGTYICHTVYAEGDIVKTFRHVRDSVSYLSLGTMLVVEHNKETTYESPAIIPIKANTSYWFICKSLMAIMACVHKLEDGETSPPIYNVKKEAA